MDKCRPDLLQKTICRLKILFGLAGETHNDVDAKKHIVHLASDIFYPATEEIGIVAPVHSGQDTVAARLQRDMEMRQEFGARGYPVYNLFCEKIWFYGRNAPTLNPIHIIQRFDQVKETLSGALAKVAGVDAGNDHFFETCGGYLIRLRNHSGYWGIAAVTAGQRHRAIGTVIVTAVLNL